MREAQRDLVRSDAKVRSLQALLEEADERCAAMNEFWNLLVEDVQLLVQEGKIPAQQHHAFINSLSISVRQPSTSAFSLSLQERNASIKAVLALIVGLTPGSSPEVDEVQARCHRLAEESASLRAKLGRVNAERDDLIDELNATIEQLRRTERHHDRFHSVTVKATERPGAQKEEEAERAKEEAAEAERHAAVQRKTKAEKEIQGDVPNGAGHTASAEELDDARRLAESRLRECDEWRQHVATLRRENEALKAEVQNIPQDRLVSSDLYRELHRLYELAGEEHARLSSLNDRLEMENSDLRERRQEFEIKAKGEADQVVDELRAAVKMHEADVARLRSQRDELTAELTEKKNRESLKYTQIDEIKALVRTKDMRISSLKAEVRRLQLSLAAKGGNAGLIEHLRSRLDEAALQDVEAEIEMISVLQSRLKTAEENSADLRRQLDACSSSTTEQDLTSKVSSLQCELEKLTAIIGQAGRDESRTANEVKATLRSQHDDLQQARQELATGNASTTALCDELDKLGAAYSEAQNVASARITELGRMEEKVARLTTEKAKADNKYFSAMRAKDAVENEKRAALRNVERQSRALEKYAETEKVVQDQMQKYESEVTALRRFVKEANAKVTELQSTVAGLKDNLDKSQQAVAAAAALSQQRSDEYLEESRQRMSAQERCEKLQRELDKCRKQLVSAGGSRKKGSVGDDDQIEALNSLLRCSACKDKYRDRIITRCLHTFCHECVDARIQTRQRKCPSCGLGFSTSDVQTLFFQ